MADLKNHRQCDRCRKIYSVEPFANMAANGTLNHSRITIYDQQYDLCPTCTAKIYTFLMERTK